MSVFSNIDQSLQAVNTFWSPYSLDNYQISLKGKLFEVVNSKTCEENTYVLSGNFLIKLNKISQDPEFMVNVEWKLIDPFIEENGSSILYGLSLGHKESSKDFYVNSEDELQMWLEKFSRVGIMTGIKDSFDFKKVIGNGAFSTVYLAINLKDKKKYAIKVISKQKIGKEINPLLNEIKIMRKINHPNIVNLYKVYESFSNVYLVIDYVEGGDLFTRIREKKIIQENTVKKFTRKILKVLDYLKSQKIIHRDIKLENILLKAKDNDYDFKLADFGLATEFQDYPKLRCGSPGYIAPEILRKQPYGFKVDTFSAGIIIYTLLTGKMPFCALTPQKILEKNINCNINFDGEIFKHISNHAVSLVKKLTCVCPELRIIPEKALLHKWFSNSKHKLSPRPKSVILRQNAKFVINRKLSKSGEIVCIPTWTIKNSINHKKVQNLRQKLMKFV